MLKRFSVVAVVWLTACADEGVVKSKSAKDTTLFVSNDTISEVRPFVSDKPVASWAVSVDDPKLEQKFGVHIYETNFTFKYLLRMQHGGMHITDTLKVPNFGTLPVVRIRPGKDKMSCIIGFLDQNKEFKEYKKLVADGNQMKLIVLKKYSTGVYESTK